MPSGLFLKPGQNNHPGIMFSARYLPPGYAGATVWAYSYTNAFQVLKYLAEEFEDTLCPVPQSAVDIAKSYGNTGFKQTPGYH
jgi:hypothetical protein